MSEASKTMKNRAQESGGNAGQSAGTGHLVSAGHTGQGGQAGQGYQSGQGTHTAAGTAAGLMDSAKSTQREAQRAGYDKASSARNTESGSTANRFANATAAADAQPSWMDQLRHTFKGELEKVQGLAISASLGLIRDFVSQSAPPPFKNHITEILNDMTAKLGGKTISEPFLSSSQDHNPAV